MKETTVIDLNYYRAISKLIEPGEYLDTEQVMGKNTKTAETTEHGPDERAGAPQPAFNVSEELARLLKNSPRADSIECIVWGSVAKKRPITAVMARLHSVVKELPAERAEKFLELVTIIYTDAEKAVARVDQ